jgi:hypothetical protein
VQARKAVESRSAIRCLRVGFAREPPPPATDDIRLATMLFTIGMTTLQRALFLSELDEFLVLLALFE